MKITKDQKSVLVGKRLKVQITVRPPNNNLRCNTQSALIWMDSEWLDSDLADGSEASACLLYEESVIEFCLYKLREIAD